jgi:hypothetical protein
MRFDLNGAWRAPHVPRDGCDRFGRVSVDRVVEVVIEGRTVSLQELFDCRRIQWCEPKAWLRTRHGKWDHGYDVDVHRLDLDLGPCVAFYGVIVLLETRLISWHVSIRTRSLFSFV